MLPADFENPEEDQEPIKEVTATLTMSSFAPTGRLLAFYTFDAWWICCCQATKNCIGVFVRSLLRKASRKTTQHPKFDCVKTHREIPGILLSCETENGASSGFCSSCSVPWGTAVCMCAFGGWLFAFPVLCIIKALKSCSETVMTVPSLLQTANISPCPNWFFCTVCTYIYLD